MNKRIVHITTVHHPKDPRIVYKEIPSLCAAGYDVHLIVRKERSLVDPSIRAARRTTEATAQTSVVDSGAPPTGKKSAATVHYIASTGRGVLARLKRGRLAYRKALELKGALYHVHDPELLPFLWRIKLNTRAVVVYDMHEDYSTRGRLSGTLVRRLERWAFGWLDHVVLADQSYVPIMKSERVGYGVIENYPHPIESGAGAFGGPEPDGQSGETIQSQQGIIVDAAANSDESIGSQDDGSLDTRLSSDVREFASVLALNRARPPRLIYTGVIARSRGLFEMIDLAERLTASAKRADERGDTPFDVRLDLVGTCYIDADRREAECQIAAANLDEIITRVGWDQYVDAPAMDPYLRRASVGLILLQPHPNYVGVLPTKLFEYLQYGLPVLCSDFPRLREFVEQNQCGAAIDPTDTEEVLQVLQTWLSDPEEYKRLSDNALKASRSFEWPEMGKRLCSAYADLLAGN